MSTAKANLSHEIQKRSYKLGVYSFSAGCLCFTIDAIRTLPLRRGYLAGCILFDVGCAFFAIDAHASAR